MLDSANIQLCRTIYGDFYAWKEDLITRQLIQFSAHTRNEIAMIRSFIREGDTCLDIGAHIGTFSIPLARFNKEKGKIYSFEACPENYSLLERNIYSNRLEKTIISENKIVSSLKKQKFTKIPIDNNSGGHSFIPSSENVESVLNTIDLNEWYESNPNIKINFVKIDVEGAEVDVLDSCKKIIKNNLPIIYIEIKQNALAKFATTPEDVEVRLKSLGYSFFRNIGSRNSDNDKFELSYIKNVKDGGAFYDLLAIHPSNPRYPSSLEYLRARFNAFNYGTQRKVKNVSSRIQNKMINLQNNLKK